MLTNVGADGEAMQVLQREPAKRFGFGVGAHLPPNDLAAVDQVDVLMLPVDALDLDVMRQRHRKDPGFLSDLGGEVRSYEKSGLFPHLAEQRAQRVLRGLHMAPRG